MINRWAIVIGLIIFINLLNFIWLTNVKFKATLGRRKKWKRLLSLFFFIFAPLVFVINLLSWPYAALSNLALGALGTWFGISQLKFAQRHSAVPQIVEPLSTFYLFLAGILFLYGAMTIV